MACNQKSSGDTVDAGAIVGNKDEQNSGDSVDAGTFTVEKMSSSAKASSSALNSEDQWKYKMDYANLGRCLIINNESFTSTGLCTRTGTNVDAAALEKTFKALGYKVDVHKNLTKKQMKEVLKEVSKEDHSENASFVCAILSHGNDEEIFGTDKAVKLEDLTQYFKGEECKSLIGKPKLFFLQACRGTKLDAGVTDRDMIDATSLPIRQKIPVEADFLYAYATAPGHYAWRNCEDGSWFIQSLCEVLPKYKHLELMQIMTRVNRKVAFDFESSNTTQGLDGRKAAPCIASLLTKDFYFP